MTCRQEIGIAGNIGLLRSKVEIYEHNPFWARPYQNFSFPFSKAAGAELLKNEKEKPKVNFTFGNAMLNHIPEKRWNNFIAVEKDGKLDISRGLKNYPDVDTLLPGGAIYEQSKKNSQEKEAGDDNYVLFKHFLWLQESSSVFYDTTVMPPSDYSTPTAALTLVPFQEILGETYEDFLEKQRFQITAGTATWDMISEVDTQSNQNYVYPMMVGRRACSDLSPIHWTIRKLTPMYQGEDFSIEFIIPDKVTDDYQMKEPTAFEELKKNTMRSPYSAFFDPIPINVVKGSNEPIWYEEGVSSPWYYPAETNESIKDPQSSINQHISHYYLKNKAYIIIELGNESSRGWAGSTNRTVEKDSAMGHNYFLMLAKGQYPTLLHWGMEPRGFDGKGPLLQNGDARTILEKLRIISVFEDVTVDELFKTGRFRVTLQNVLGDFVISFSGQNKLWRISRDDFVIENGEAIRQRIPMVVENGPIKIHGGNMTLGFSFGPLRYHYAGNVFFRDREADIHQTNDNDMYATFAHPGDNTPLSPYSSSNTRSKTKGGLFRDEQFNHLKMGYSADACIITEIHKNLKKTVDVYKIFKDNFVLYGKEYARVREGTGTNLLYPGEKASSIDISVVKNFSENEANGNITPVGNSYRFDLSGLPLSYMGTDGTYIGKWNVQITLSAGDVRLPTNKKLPVEEVDYLTGSLLCPDTVNATLYNCITPIATCWNLIVLGGGKVVTKDMKEDISEFVTSINDGWQAEEYSHINHEAKLKVYLPINIANKETKDKVSRILSLIDKMFYITISYWWENGVGLYYSLQDTDTYNPKRPKPGDDYNPRLIQMTGLVYNMNLERSANVVVLSFDVKDYMEPLRQQLIFNCPFFDSVSDVSAVLELARMAHFDNTTITSDIPGQQDKEGIDRRPLGFLQRLQKSTFSSLSKPIVYNEEKHVHLPFALPGSYASINSPSMKFNNTTKISEIIDKLVKISGKTYYFDRYGVLIIEISPAKLAAYKRTQVDTTNPNSPLFDIDVQSLIKASFATTPRGKIWDRSSKEMVDFDPQKHTPFLVYNSVKASRGVMDALNQITIYTAQAPDPDDPKKSGLILAGRTFYDQIWNPDAEGFFGYRKMAYISNGIYGDKESVNNSMEFYARFKFPPLKVSFECFGLPGLKPLDVIMLDNQPLYITEINHELDPKTNSWWMSVNCEWIKSYDDSLFFPPTTTTVLTNSA